MKLPVPLKELDIVPDDALLNYDFTNVSLNQLDYKNDQINKIFEGNIGFPFIFTNFNPTMTDIISVPTQHVNTETELYSLAMVEVKKIEACLNASAKIAVISAIKPYGRIHKHFDQSKIFHMCHRIHLPIITSPNAIFTIDDTDYNLERGKVYEFDNTRFHSVFNNSDQIRIHLLVDLLPNKES